MNQVCIKGIRKITLSTILTISVSIILIQCKSPEKPTEASTHIIAAVDSVQTASTEASDTVIPAVDTATSRIPLTLIVNKIASSTAPVIVGVYGSAHHFLNIRYRLKGYEFVPKGNIITAQITDLPYGELAIAIYQDVNNNGKFDKTLIGIPKEAYAFSNNFIPKSKAPTYDDCKFRYDSINHTVTMTLIK